MDTISAQKLIQETAKNYDAIADYFSNTRQGQWYAVSSMIEHYVQPRQRILDLGCGNGRIADLAKQIKAEYVGMDISKEMIAIAKRMHPEYDFRVGTILDTGFPENHFDHVLLIASFHHIPSEQLRIHALEEIKRIVKPGGYVLMTNWNLHQWRYTGTRYKTNIERFFGRHHRDANDLLIPWKNASGTILAQRYYHSFTLKEIARLARLADMDVIDQWYDSNGMHVPRRKAHNLISILQKKY